MPRPFDFDSYEEMFLDSIRQANPSGGTADTYATALKELGDWLELLPDEAIVIRKAGQREIVKVPAGIVELADLTPAHLNAHIRYLQTREHLPGGKHGRAHRVGVKLSPGTVNNRYRAISSFVNWLWRQSDFSDCGPTPMGSVPSPKLVEQTTRAFEPLDLQVLIGTCGTGRKRPFLDVRDEVILRVLCEAGPRKSEAATAALANLDLPGRRLLLEGWQTKGMRDRYIPFGKDTRLKLQRYVAMRAQHRYAHLPALWLAPKGALTPGGLYQMIRRRGDLAGIKIHPHQLRHSFANIYLDKGGKPEDLKQIGGWESDKAMSRYVKQRAAQRALASYDELGIGDLF